MPGAYVNPWWQASLIPARWDICGVSVGALSVWHLYALENINNGYARGRVCDRDDAASLLLICSRGYAAGRDLFFRPRDRFKAMQAAYKSVRSVEWPRLDTACLDYFRACTRTPEHLVSTDGTDKPYAAPYQRHIILCLCDHYRMTEAQAWDHPYAEARCKYDVWGESRGGDSLASPRIQRDTDAALERQVAL